MNKIIPSLATIALLVTLLGTNNVQAFGSYGMPYTPTFGGGPYHYADGLVINGKTFDVSGYSQKIATQNLTVRIP